MRFIIALCLLFCSSTVWAKYYIEPYVGYSMGSNSNQQVETGTNIDRSGTNSQMLYGARVGYALTMWIFGAEYAAGKFSFTDSGHVTTGGVTFKSDSSYTLDLMGLGAFAALDLKTYQPYAAYFPYVKLGTGITGTGYKVGIAYKHYAPIDLNFEMLVLNCNQIEASDVDYSLKATAYMFSVSWPLSF